MGTFMEIPPDRAVFQARQQEWRFAQANNEEIWKHDSDLDSVRRAEKLREDDPKAAFAQLHALAEAGSVWSMLLTGYAYLTGEGTTADEAAAEQWLRRAAGLGCQDAQLRLGSLYRKRRDFVECERIYGMGPDGVWSPATYYLAWAKLRQPATPQRTQDARRLLELAASQGDIEAELDLSVLMVRGRFGMRLIPVGLRRSFPAAGRAVAFCDSTAPV